MKLSTASLSGRTYLSDPNTLDTTNLPLATADPNVTDKGGGSADLKFSSGGGLFFQRSSLVPPFDAEISLQINVIDSDLVPYSSNPAKFGTASAGSGIGFSGGKEQRFGRLVVTNALGSETQNLPVPVQAQYYDLSGNWVDNTDDVCSSLTTAHLDLTQSPPSLSSAVIDNLPDFVLGTPALYFVAPGAGNQGYVQMVVNLSNANLEWLFYDWDGDSSYDDNPSGRATFGVYKGQDVFIFLRELY